MMRKWDDFQKETQVIEWLKPTPNSEKFAKV
jgi:hypothetical protein